MFGDSRLTTCGASVPTQGKALGVEEESSRCDQGPLCSRDLSVTGQALELVDRLTEVAGALRATLRQGSTVRVDRDPTVDQDTTRSVSVVDPVLGEEVTGLSRTAPPGVLDPAEHDEAESVVGEVDVDVVDPEVALASQGVYYHLLTVVSIMPAAWGMM